MASRNSDVIADQVKANQSPPKRSAEERFWAKVEKRGECWEFTGYRAPFGHGRMAYRGAVVFVHRFSYELHYGPIPPGLCVLHRCDNPPCVNPAHLFLGTRRDNVADMVAKDRFAKGERIPHARLTADLVRAFRREAGAGKPVLQIAREAGLPSTTVDSAVRGVTWRHI